MPVFFNSTTKTVIRHKFGPENYFQEILYRIDNWINEGSDGLLNQSSLNTLTFQRTDHKKVMKKQFNKNVTITEEEDEQYQSSNTCWIC